MGRLNWTTTGHNVQAQIEHATISYGFIDGLLDETAIIIDEDTAPQHILNSVYHEGGYIIRQGDHRKVMEQVTDTTLKGYITALQNV